MDKKYQKLTIPQTIESPPRSKSYTNRALIRCCFLRKPIEIFDLSLASDCTDLLDYLKSIGVKVQVNGNRYKIIPPKEFQSPKNILKETLGGTTFRFFVIFCACNNIQISLKMSSQIQRRKLDELLEVFTKMKVNYKIENDRLSLYDNAKIVRKVNLDSITTTQYISALLLNDIDVEYSNVTSSKDYIAMTKNVLEKIEHSDQYQVPVDFSSLSYLVAYSFIHQQEIRVKTVGEIDKLQGDSLLFKLIKKNYQIINRDLIIKPGVGFTIKEMDCSHCLDLVPTLILMSVVAKTHSRLTGLQNLIYKESNRLLALKELFLKFNIHLADTGDSLEVKGFQIKKPRAPIKLPYDHRIALVAILLGSLVNFYEFSNIESITKSYPEFLNYLS
jgi:3-phosphoshikimate 1-carboxyvinyltransferase